MHSGPADRPPSVIAESKGAEYLGPRVSGHASPSCIPSPSLSRFPLMRTQCSPPVKPSSKLRVKDVPRPRQVTLHDQGQ